MATRAPGPLLLLLGLLLLPGGGAGGLPAEGGLRDTGERFRYAPTGAEFRVLRDPATGEKALERSDGARRGSVEEAVLAEEALLSPLRLRVHPELLPAVEDPARAGEPVRVVLVLAGSPLREEVERRRDALEEAVAPRLARIRAVLGALAPSRAEDPGRELQVGHRMEEEARLLDGEAREELRLLRAAVQEALRAHRREAFEAALPRALALQEPLADALAALPGARVLGRSVLLHAVAAEVPAGALPGLLDEHPEVERALPHGTRRTGLNTSVTTLGASSWTGAGYDGSSSTLVAVLDTGIDAAHPALSSVMGAQAVFLAVGSQSPWFDDNASSTDDIHSHGTHVGGIVMSTDAAYRGVAPGGVLLNAKCGYRLLYQGNYYGALEDADILAAADWAASQGADAMNLSFGGGATTDGSSALALAFDAAADDLGVSVAAAAGNAGPGAGTVITPADGFNVLTVGSLDDRGTTTHADNLISSFSSRGPLDDGRRKPDLCTPGSSITSCNNAWEGAGADFVAKGGTSMAAPHAAGAMALLLDYASSWRPEGVRALLMGTTRNTSPYPAAPDDTWGTGAADLAAAFTSRATVLEGRHTSTGRRAVFVLTGSLLAGRRATLCWNREVKANGASAPVTYRAATDLDLLVYEGSDQSARGSSTATLDSWEQVKLSSAATFPVLKVLRNGSFPSGQTEVRWAVATDGTGASRIAVPPTLRCAFTALPSTARGDAEFPVEVTVTNDGDLQAAWPEVTLTLPPGYALVSGDNPATLVTIAEGGSSRVASWTVRAPSTGNGTRTFSAAAVTVTFGETFAGAAGAGDQVLDTQPPEGFLTIAGGRAAVAGPAVPLQVIAYDNLTGVAGMRFRNGSTGAWSDWEPYAASRGWTLAPGEGPRTVECQFVDGAGNPSAVLDAGVLVDQTPPTGTFTLLGGAPYAMPWEPLLADTLSDDGAGGSGVEDFRYRWGPGEAWSAWLPLDGSPPALDRPAAEQGVVAEGQFRDGAGNTSASAFDGIHLVEAAPPSLTAVRSWKGGLAPGGDIDAFRIGLLPGDILTVKVKSRATEKGEEFVPLLDLLDPSGARLVEGRFPADGRRPGIRKFRALLPGDHWLVLLPGGADGSGGGPVSLSVKVKRSRVHLRPRGEAAPGEGEAVVDFMAPGGAVLRGRVAGAVTGAMELEEPGGGTVPLPSLPAGGGTGRRIPPFVLGGSTGIRLLRVPAAGPVTFSLSVRPARPGRATEAAE